MVLSKLKFYKYLKIRLIDIFINIIFTNNLNTQLIYIKN